MNNFKISLITILSLSLFLANGCGTKKEEGKVVTWAFWGYPKADKVYGKIVQDFEKDFPDVKVKLLHFSGDYYTKVQTMMAGGVAPDIIWLDDDNYREFAKKGSIVDLMSYVEKDKFGISDFYPSVFDAYRYKGGLYGIPKGMNVLVFFYNKDLFDKAGISYPSEDWTFEEFLEKAKQLTLDIDGDGKIDQFGFGRWESDAWLGLIWQNGGEVFNKDMTECLIDSPEAIEGLRFWADVWLRYHLSPTPLPTASQVEDIADRLFISGKVAMNCGAYCRLIEYRGQIKTFKLDVASFPRSKKKIVPVASGCFSITTQSKHPEAAWEFIKYITSPPAAEIYFKELGEEQPPRISLANVQYEVDSFLEHHALFNEEMKFSRACPIHAVKGGRGKSAAVIVDNLEFLWLGQKSAEEACHTIKIEIDKALKGEE